MPEKEEETLGATHDDLTPEADPIPRVGDDDAPAAPAGQAAPSAKKASKDD